MNLFIKEIPKLVYSSDEEAGYTRRPSPVDSSEVNEYIQSIMGENFSSKDFQTWAGTSLAVRYADTAKLESETGTRKKVDSVLVKKVVADLGNTVSVCRDYYIHPNVLEAMKADQLPTFDQVPKRIKNKFQDDLEDYEMIAYSVIS